METSAAAAMAAKQRRKTKRIQDTAQVKTGSAALTIICVKLTAPFFSSPSKIIFLNTALAPRVNRRQRKGVDDGVKWSPQTLYNIL